jgi:serine/threonine protein kinase
MSKFILPKDMEKFLWESAERIGKKDGFSIVSRLPSCNTGVYKVSDGNGFKVLKLMDSRIRRMEMGGKLVRIDTIGSINAICLENIVLKKASKSNRLPQQYDYFSPSAINRLMQRLFMTYMPPTETWILKEYIDGEPLGYRIPTGYITERYIEKNHDFIIEAVRKIHDVGYANLDIVSPNIVVSNQGMPYLIDFIGQGTVNKYEVTPGTYERYKSRDLKELHYLFKNHFNAPVRF